MEHTNKFRQCDDDFRCEPNIDVNIDVTNVLTYVSQTRDK